MAVVFFTVATGRVVVFVTTDVAVRLRVMSVVDDSVRVFGVIVTRQLHAEYMPGSIGSCRLGRAGSTVVVVVVASVLIK